MNEGVRDVASVIAPAPLVITTFAPWVNVATLGIAPVEPINNWPLVNAAVEVTTFPDEAYKGAYAVAPDRVNPANVGDAVAKILCDAVSVRVVPLIDAEIPFAEASVVDCKIPPVPKLVNVVAVAPDTVIPANVGDAVAKILCEAVSVSVDPLSRCRNTIRRSKRG